MVAEILNDFSCNVITNLNLHLYTDPLVNTENIEDLSLKAKRNS